jgi:hypothetical protein
MIPAPRNILVSYHYFKDYGLDRLGSSMRIIGDSGAYSAHSQGYEINTPELAAWGRKWKHRLLWLASLDVIGDAALTRRNWHAMVDGEGIPGVPTIHFGCDPSLMDYYAERGVDFLGLGGMVGKPINRQMRWLVSTFRYARDHHPQMRFHGWGVTAPTLLQLPFFSVDSSGWTSAQRFGRITLRDPHSNADHAIALDGRSTYTPEVARLLRDQYGVNPSEIATSSAANREIVLRVSALSASVAEQRFRRMHRPGISAPSWGISSPDAGPGVHLATMQINNAHPEALTALVADEGPHQHLALQLTSLVPEINGVVGLTDATLATATNGDRP